MRVRVRAALMVLSSVLIAVSCGGDGDPTDPVDPISIETDALAEAIEGQGYSQQLEASGGSGGYSWVLAAGSLPAGLSLTPGGVISGTAIAPGSSSFRIRATDGSGRTATADLSIAVVQALAIHTGAVPEGVVGVDYSAPLQAVGGRGTYTWSLTEGDATSWLEIAADGTLTGTPGASGVSSVMVAVADESGQQASRQLSVVVLDPLAVAEISLPTATQGRAYAAQLVATGGDGTYTWSVESGALPTGVELTTGGALTGTPADGGTYAFTVRVTDGADRVATRSISLTVERAPTIQTGSLPPADVGESYSAQLVATGGTGAYSWSLVDGALPTGLTLSATGGISGTAATRGSSTFTVQVMDAASTTHTRTLAIVVEEIAELSSGSPVTGISGDVESVRYYGIDVPTGATELRVSLSGGTGDADLYVRRSGLPAEFTYDCRPLREGNDETCTISSPAAGPWYVMIRGHTAYADVTLVATHDE